MKLPEQLRHEQYGFVKLKGKTKIPFEKGWQKKPYRFSDIENWINTGNNYGVMGGVGSLIIIDADNKKISEVISSDLPQTFTVKTPKCGHHYYFLCPDIKRKLVLKKDKEHFGEIISHGSQVVGSGSIHPDTKTAYEIFKDTDITKLSKEFIYESLGEFLIEDKMFSSLKPEELDIMTVLNQNNISLKQVSGQYACSHPIHGSNTGANLIINPAKNVWKCFRCDTGGGTLLLIAVIEQLIDCKDARPGVLRGDLFKQAIKIAEQKYGFKIKQETKIVIPAGLWNDEWNAKRFVDKHSIIIRNCDTLGGWHIWNGKYWKLDEVHKITALARDTVQTFHSYARHMEDEEKKYFIKHIRQSGNEAKLRSMASVARSWPNISVCSEDFDKDSYLLNCENGVLDLRTGQLKKHDSAFLVTKICNTYFDPRAECPEWLKFLDIIFKSDQELIDFIQKAVGYALTGDVSHQVFFILHGDGANGKSTFVETIYKILGSYAGITPTSTLTAKRGNEIPNDVARLKGLRFIISSELERSKILDEALVKLFTSEEPISARFLRQEFFEFKPTGKIFLSTNYKPTIKGTDDGIWRRIRLIPFEHKFEGSNKIEKFAEKFLYPELAGILRWAVEGCLKLQKEGMKPPDIVKGATDEYKVDEDIIGAFLDEFCEQNAGYEGVTVSELFECFKNNCDVFMRKKEFNTYLEKHGFKKERGSVGRFKGRYYWVRLKLNESSNEDNFNDRPY